MSFKKSILIMLGLMVSGISLFTLLALLHLEELQSELSPFILPAISHNGRTYTITQGQVSSGSGPASPIEALAVLKTARFILANRLDPIFAIAGTDPDLLLASTRSLERSFDSFAPLYVQAEEDTIRKHLYPLEFFKHLAQLERTRVELTENPAVSSVEAYHEQLELTITAYIDEIQSLQETYAQFGDTATTYQFFGGYSNPEILIGYLEQLKAAAYAQKQKAQERLRCFHLVIPACTPLKPEIGAAADPLVVRHIPEAIQRNRNIVADYRTSGTWYSGETYVVLSESMCFPGITPAFYEVWWKETEQSGKEFRPIHLNDLYFYDLGNYSSGYLKDLKESGLDFFYQPPNLYMCPDLGKDVAKVAAAHYIQEHLIEFPLLRDRDNPETLEALEEAERSIVTTDILSAPDVFAYTAALSNLLAQYTEVELASLVGTEAVFEIHHLVQVGKQQSPYFDEFINSIIGNNLSIDPIKNRDPDRLSFLHLLLSRGYPTLVFPVFNQSVTGGASASAVHKTENMFSNFNLVPLENVLEIKTPQEVTEIMIRGAAAGFSD